MDKQDLLYRYFSNSLSTEQESLFQSLLESDAEFKTLFEHERDLKEAIISTESDKLKSKLQGFEKDIAKPTRSLFNYRNLSIAASILILVGWFSYNSFFGTNYGDMYDANFSEYPNTVYTITRGDTNNSIERQAFVAYESKDYQTMIDKLNAIETEKDYFNFYKAQAYLGLENTTNAKQLFEQVISDNDSFVAESTWYLALIHLKNKDKDEALKYLNELVTKFEYNKDKAQTLIEELK